jgi:hypothetical protein
MIPQELRIGNWVTTCTPNMEIMIPHLRAQVQGIGLFGDVMFCHTPQINGFEMPTKHITGIPLTPEILERAGFKKCSCGGWKGAIHISKNGLNELYYKGAALKHLHHLQNLIFALCGTELDINL